MSADLELFAEKYFSAYKDKSVPLDLLMAWLSEHHYHAEDGTAIVPSMDLHRWSEKNAVTRIVDHAGEGKNEVWHFFEHGWHKSGCEAHLAQNSARIGKVDVDRVLLVTGTLDADTAAKAQAGLVPGFSVDEEDAWDDSTPYWRQSDTTGRWHSCALPPDETCYWSGDPYSPHVMGF